MLQSRPQRLSLVATLVILLGVALISGPSVERIGDRLKFVLPLAGLACAVAGGRGIHYVGRYLVLETAVNASKYGLGNLAVNQRPNGLGKGFPSGSTAAATFGATGLATTCLRENPPAQAAVLLAAGFTGGSRIEAGAHTLWQVMAGALLGWLAQVWAVTGFDRLFGRMVRRAGRLMRFNRSTGPSVAVLAVALMALAPAARAEFEISLYTGLQNAHSTDVTGNDPTGVGPFDFGASWDGKSSSAPPYYGVRATWWRNEAWGYHLDFTHSKAYASGNTLADSGFQTLEFTDGLNNITVGVSRRWLDLWGRVTPYVGLGAGVAFPNVEVQTTPTSARTFEYQVTGPNVAWMAGVSYALSDNWRVFGEYKGTYAWLDADLTGGGSLETNIWTNALNFGVSYAF